MKHLPEEHKQKIREANTGKKFSLEHRNKFREVWQKRRDKELKDFEEAAKKGEEYLVEWVKNSPKCYIDSFYQRRIYKKEPFAHFVWNLYHPDNKKVKGDGFHVHHKDFDQLNDAPDNLDKITLIEHNKIHKKENKNCIGRKLSQETKRKISDSQKRRLGSL